MSRSTIRHEYVAVARGDASGIVHVEVESTQVSDDSADVQPEDCFDPASCCDRQERAMIASLREYLRPSIAPECLIRRLNATLDRCCCDVEEHRAGERRGLPADHRAMN